MVAHEIILSSPGTGFNFPFQSACAPHQARVGPLLSPPGLLACSFITLIAVWATVTAVSLLPRPTLVSMVRSTEIPISLVTEALYWSELPGPVSVLGSIIVSHNVTSWHVS